MEEEHRGKGVWGYSDVSDLDHWDYDATKHYNNNQPASRDIQCQLDRLGLWIIRGERSTDLDVDLVYPTIHRKSGVITSSRQPRGRVHLTIKKENLSGQFIWAVGVKRLS